MNPARIAGRRDAVNSLHFALVLVLAATLRVPNLDKIEIDEPATIATHEEGSIRKIFASWRDHPCANLAAFASVKLAWALRGGSYPLWAGKLPSLVAGLGAIWLLYATALRYTSHIPALTAALFLAASSQHVIFSTSMRGYSFQVFGVLAMTYCFARAIEGGRRGRGWWAAYGVGVVLASWSHLWALLVMAGQAAYLVLLSWPRARKWLGAGPPPGLLAGLSCMAASLAVLGILFAPMWRDISGVVGGDPKVAGEFWRSLVWAHVTNLDQVRPYLSSLLGWGLVAVIACGILRGVLSTRLGSLSACLLATVALILLARPPGAFGTRYLLFLPALSLLLAAACFQKMPRVAELTDVDGQPRYLPRIPGDLAVLAATAVVAVGLVTVVVASRDAASGLLRELPCIQWPDYGAVAWVVVALQARITPTTRRLVLAVGAVEGLYFAATLTAEILEATPMETARICLIVAIGGLFVPYFRRGNSGGASGTPSGGGN